jgi:hypothetical protein
MAKKDAPPERTIRALDPNIAALVKVRNRNSVALQLGLSRIRTRGMSGKRCPINSERVLAK